VWSGGGEVKRKVAGRKADHSTSSGGDVKNKWSSTSTYPSALHDVHRDGISTFFCLL
jgi:hypothetical protein